MNGALAQLFAELKAVTGIDLRGFRPETATRRLEMRMQRLRLDSLEVYLEHLRQDPLECQRLIDAMAINVSSFFRDPIVFELLEQQVLPEILERKRAAGRYELRVWSAACACGEEAYSLAILLHRLLQKEWELWQLNLFGTDIDQAALDAAGRAVFSRDSLRSAKLEVVDRYFEVCEDGFALKAPVLDLVSFSRHNLLDRHLPFPAESVFGSFDVVLCRNMMIYFSEEARQTILSSLVRAVAPNGYLILGSSETLPEVVRHLFREVDVRNRIYRKVQNVFKEGS